MTKTVWIVRWRGLEEECAGRQDAMDRWGQLDARGIEAQVLEVLENGQERPITATDEFTLAAAIDAAGSSQGKALGAQRARARTQTSARGR